MPTLTIKGLPDALYRRLKERADAHRRSLNREVIVCLEQATALPVVDPQTWLTDAARLRARLALPPLTERRLRHVKTSGRPWSSPIRTSSPTCCPGARARRWRKRCFCAIFSGRLLFRGEASSAVLASYLRRRELEIIDAIEVQHKAEALLAGREHVAPSERVLRLVASSTCSAYDCECGGAR